MLRIKYCARQYPHYQNRIFAGYSREMHDVWGGEARFVGVDPPAPSGHPPFQGGQYTE